MSKIKVTASFSAQATWTKEIEMTATEFAEYTNTLTLAAEEGRREERYAVQELFEALGFSLAEPSDWDDATLDDFYVVGDK